MCGHRAPSRCTRTCCRAARPTPWPPSPPSSSGSSQSLSAAQSARDAGDAGTSGERCTSAPSCLGSRPSSAPARRPRPALSSPGCACATQRGTPLAGLTARGSWPVARCGCPGRPFPSRGAGGAGAHWSPLVRSPGAGDGCPSRSFAGPMEESSGKPLSFEEKEKVRGAGRATRNSAPFPGIAGR